MGQSETCAPILRLLPDWFGIESATEQYISDIKNNQTFLAVFNQETVGFLTLTYFQDSAAEIHVMGIHPDFHHQGIGKELLQAAEHHLQEAGYQYLQVKTLSDRHPDPYYAKTRAFYLAVGFVPLQEFPELWGVENPCLQMIKKL